MIKDQLGQLLDGIVMPERINLYMELLSCFDNYSVTDHIYYLMELISARDTYERAEIVLHVDSIFHDTIDDVLENVGIVLNDGVDLQTCCDVLQGLQTIEVYDDMQRLADIIDGLDDVEEALCACIGEVLSMPAEDLYPVFSTVDPAILDNIVALVPDTDVPETPGVWHDDVDAYNRLKERLRTFIIHRPDSIVERLISDGVRIGLPLDTYMQTILDNGWLPITELPDTIHLSRKENELVNGMAQDLAGVWLMAGVRGSHAIDELNNYVTQWGISTVAQSNFLSAARDIMLEVLSDG